MGPWTGVTDGGALPAGQARSTGSIRLWRQEQARWTPWVGIASLGYRSDRLFLRNSKTPRPLLVIRAMDFSWLRHSANPASTSRSIRARCFCCSGLMPRVVVEIMLPPGSADISFRISLHFGSRRRLASSLGSGNNPQFRVSQDRLQDRAVRPSILR